MDVRIDGDRGGAIRPKSLKRWRRLSLLAQGTMPPMMLLEDAEDICDFLEATKRTVRAARWAEEAIAAGEVAALEGLF
jgi:hypothetical protein